MPEEVSSAEGQIEGFESTENGALRLDLDDPLAAYREEFLLPPGKIYLAGNSLGLQSNRARNALLQALADWERLGVRGWVDAERPWFFMAERLGEACAELVGASPDEVVATGTTTINIHALISSFYKPSGRRTKILADELNFPSDLYALQGQLKLRGYSADQDLLLVRSTDGRTLDEQTIIDMMTEEVALVFLPSVLYSSGQRLDLATLTRAAHQRGIVIGFDCSHSVGVLKHELDLWDIDFALWCSYKYLNGGPGASAFLYVNRRHRDLEPTLVGWFGFIKEQQFEMLPEFRPEPGARGWQISSPGILGAAPLEGALELALEAGIDRLEAKSGKQTSYLMALVDELLSSSPYHFEIGTPRERARRGGHVSLTRVRNTHKISSALKARGVIHDFRPPDLIRFAPSPLFTSYHDIWRAVQSVRELIDCREHEQFKDSPSIVP